MKNYSRSVCALAVLLVVFACKPDVPVVQDTMSQVNITASTESLVSTKSYVNFPSVRWEASDKILVASSSSVLRKFEVEDGKSVGMTAPFHGEVVSGAKELFGVYPADETFSIDYAAGTFEVEVPYVQIVDDVNTSRGALIAVGRSTDGKTMMFRNVCGLVKVDVSRNDVVDIVVSGSAVAGRVTVNADASIESRKTVKTSVTLRKNDSSPLEPGSYFLAVLPGTTPDGKFKVTVHYSDGSSDASAARDVVTVSRRGCLDFGDLNTKPAEPDPEPDPEPGEDDPTEAIQMAVVRVTNSTASIAWTTDSRNVPYLTTYSADYDPTPDENKAYRLCLYKDAACTNLVVGWNLPVAYAASKGGEASSPTFSSKVCPRFIFGGLEPSTKYYVTVTDLASGKTRKNPFAFTTAARSDAGLRVVSDNASVGDCVLSESFDRFMWGGDMTTYASGYSRYDRSSLTSVDAATAKGFDPLAQDEQFYPVIHTVEMGLFNTMAKVLDDAGVGEWGWIADDNTSSAICLRPGYVKVGANSKHSSLVTPVLRAIPAGQEAEVTVKFKMAAYGSFDSFDDAERVMNVRVFDNTSTQSDRRIVSYDVMSTSETITVTGEGQWKEYTVKFSGVTPTSRIAFGGVRPGTGVQSRFMIDDIRVIVDKLSRQDNTLYAEGYVKDASGNPQKGISVSDGFHVAVTDADGYYRLNTTKDVWYIYISLPEDAKIVKNSNGMPDFYKRYTTGQHRYDFSYEKQAVETQFSLFAMADPQAHYAKRSPQTIADTDRFSQETVPALNTHIASKSLPCYGVTLGDIVYSENGRNSNSGMTTMRNHFSKVNMPVFQTMGNHDFTYFYTSTPLTTDETSSTLYLKAQRKFEDCFGPINYSFNRGKVHVICLRNINYNNTTDNQSYIGGFTDEQWSWIQADLANVPKSKAVIICVHIPLVSLSSGPHVMDVLNLIKQYTNSRVFSGHTHYQRNTPNCLSTGIYEHVHPAVCGQWWWSNISGDGCPNGYSVYDFNGTVLTDWYFMGVNKGMNVRSNQMRLYRGNALVGGPNALFQQSYPANTLLINVFNADDNWSVKVYENGSLSGTASKMAVKKTTFSSVTAGQTYTIPATSNQDWWCIGYHIGIVGRGMSNTSYYTTQYHMYRYDLKNASSSVKVVATDSFGNSYECSEIVTDTYNSGNYPAYFAPGNNY